MVVSAAKGAGGRDVTPSLAERYWREALARNNIENGSSGAADIEVSYIASPAEAQRMLRTSLTRCRHVPGS